MMMDMLISSMMRYSFSYVNFTSTVCFVLLSTCIVFQFVVFCVCVVRVI